MFLEFATRIKGYIETDTILYYFLKMFSDFYITTPRRFLRKEGKTKKDQLSL